jgi:hypothetical protein
MLCNLMFHLRSACERVTRSIALSSGLRALLDMHNSLNELAGRGKVSASVLLDVAESVG